MGGIRGPNHETNLLQGVPSSAQTAVSRAVKSPWRSCGRRNLDTSGSRGDEEYEARHHS